LKKNGNNRVDQKRATRIAKPGTRNA